MAQQQTLRFENCHRMLSMSEKMILCLAVVLCVSFGAHGSTRMDVLDYSLTLEPDIANKTIRGAVFIRVLTDSREVEFNCGELTIDSVTEKGKPLQFSVNDHKLRVSLTKTTH